MNESNAGSILTTARMEQGMDLVYHKPVVLFLGDSGIGKMSCIRAIMKSFGGIQLTFPVSNHPAEADSENSMQVADGENILCVNIRGQRRQNTQQQYDKYVNSVLSTMRRIDLIVGVVKADHPRSEDIDAIATTLEMIIKHFAKPFLILMNKTDSVQDSGRVTYRKNLLSKQISTFLTNDMRLLYHGVFGVSADLPLEFRKCSNTLATDDVLDAHNARMLGSGIFYCQDCKQAEIAEALITEQDREEYINIKEMLISKGVRLINAAKASHGFESDSDVIKTFKTVLKPAHTRETENLEGTCVDEKETNSNTSRQTQIIQRLFNYSPEVAIIVRSVRLQEILAENGLRGVLFYLMNSAWHFISHDTITGVRFVICTGSGIKTFVANTTTDIKNAIMNYHNGL